jgi:hypothetical protein
MHEHTFEEHVGIPVFGGSAVAWIRPEFVTPVPDTAPRTQLCVSCGEQGYEVPA